MREAHAIRKQTFGYIFQQYLLIKHFTILENTMLPLQYHPIQKTQYKRLAQAALDRIGLLRYQDHYPTPYLEDNNKKRLYCPCNCYQPKIILADEPTGALDATNSTAIVDLLQEICRNDNTTVILVTHDLAIARRCQRQITMQSITTPMDH